MVRSVQWVLLVAALVVLVRTGCAGPNQELLVRVRPGSTVHSEVLRLLGQPTLSTPEVLVYLGADGRQAVVFLDGQGVVSQTRWWAAPNGVARVPAPADESPPARTFQ